MAGFRAAHRYAKGLMEFANEANQTDVVYAEMNDVSKIIKENDDLRIFLNSPVIDAKKKEAVLNEIFKSLSKFPASPVQTISTVYSLSHSIKKVTDVQ